MVLYSQSLNWSLSHSLNNCSTSVPFSSNIMWCKFLTLVIKSWSKLVFLVTITSQPNLVSSIPSPIGSKQCAASLSCPNKKRTTSGRLSLNANILNGLWTRWRKDIASLLVRSLMAPITKALQLPKLSPVKSKLRVTLSYPTHKVFVKVSKRSVVDMAFKPTSKVAVPSKTSCSPPRTKTLWSTKVVPYIGTNVVT